MLILRRLLQLAFGLVAAAVLFITIRAPGANVLTNLVFVAFFILIILVLGPWWPSADKISKWKLNLPTDSPRIAFPLFAALLGGFSFFRAWDTYVRPNQEFRRFELFVSAQFGVTLSGSGVQWSGSCSGQGQAYTF